MNIAVCDRWIETGAVVCLADKKRDVMEAAMLGGIGQELLMLVNLLVLLAGPVGCAVLARKKGYSAGLWALLGLLFSVIALGILWGMPEKE